MVPLNVHVVTCLWVAHQGGSAEGWDSPESGGLLDAPTGKLIIVNIHRRKGENKRPRLQKSGLWIFYPPFRGLKD